jgi:uncharacterized membrane protein AbrB (regulator of aidB expression)
MMRALILCALFCAGCATFQTNGCTTKLGYALMGLIPGGVEMAAVTARREYEQGCR